MLQDEQPKISYLQSDEKILQRSYRQSESNDSENIPDEMMGTINLTNLPIMIKLTSQYL